MAMTEDKYTDWEQYERASEPHKRERAEYWRTAIGLQQVDGLQVSDYLRQTAEQNIEGNITIDEARERIKTYYITKTSHDNGNGEEEADKVATNIAKLLAQPSFSFTANEMINIHRHIFTGVFKHAGLIRSYDITKKEWVLRGDTVIYGRAADIRMALNYDIEQERNFSYKGLSADAIIQHLAQFISLLWQNHPFCEGNTRATALFFIKYVRTLGFDADNTLFANNSWYFRNALVRANYRNVAKGIEADTTFLVRFLRNLLFGEHHELRNRHMLINPPEEWNEQDKHKTSTRQAQDKHKTSTEQAQDKYKTSNDIDVPNSLKTLLLAIATRELSVREMMENMGLKARANFLATYLTPAINQGLVRMRYPDNPRHPRQKYLLSAKGLAWLNGASGGN